MQSHRGGTSLGEEAEGGRGEQGPKPLLGVSGERLSEMQ